METKTITSNIATFIKNVTPGLYVVGFRTGTANLGTLVAKTTWDGVASDPGQSIKDPNGSAYSYDLSAVTSGGFKVLVTATGSIVLSVSGGTNDQTIHFSVERIDP